MSNIHICFGPPLVEVKPTDPLEGYRMWVPYPVDFPRPTLGRATCDCEQVLEVDRPWMGVSWSHSPDCAIEKHLRRYPGIYNFIEDAGGIFAHTE